MWNKIVEWLNVRDNVTFLIAVASFALSIWNFASDKIKNRKNLIVEVQNVFCMGPSPEKEYTEVLNICFINKSREAITLSRLELSSELGECAFGEYRLKLLTNSRKHGIKELSRSEWYSDIFPIKVEGLGYEHMVLSSTGSTKHIAENAPYKLKVFSNKGIITKTFTSDFSNAGMLSQCREPDSHTEALEWVRFASSSSPPLDKLAKMRVLQQKNRLALVGGQIQCCRDIVHLTDREFQSVRCKFSR